MEIKAKCTYDKEVVKSLFYVSLYKKSTPIKSFVLRCVSCCFIILVGICSYSNFRYEFIPIIYIVCGIVGVVCNCLMHFVIPGVQYKALEKMKNIENIYVFSDNVMKIYTKSQVYNSESELEYSLFVKVYETSKYFFLYQTQNQTLIVDKSTIEDGTVDDIRNKLLCYVKNKYIICKY